MTDLDDSSWFMAWMLILVVSTGIALFWVMTNLTGTLDKHARTACIDSGSLWTCYADGHGGESCMCLPRRVP